MTAGVLIMRPEARLTELKDSLFLSISYGGLLSLLFSPRDFLLEILRPGEKDSLCLDQNGSVCFPPSLRRCWPLMRRILAGIWRPQGETRKRYGVFHGLGRLPFGRLASL